VAQIPIAPDAAPDVKEALKVIERRLSILFGGSGGRNVDWHGRRIINAGDAVQDQDYVTLAQVKKLIAGLDDEPALPDTGSGGTGGGGGSSSQFLGIFTADPAGPADPSFWITYSGVTPSMTVSLRFNISGVTDTLIAVVV